MMEPFGIIYLTSRVEGGVIRKQYVGQQRLKCGITEDGYIGSGVLLTRAIKKYGKESFAREVLELCYSQAEMNEAEKKWILFYSAHTSNRFYNLAEGGSSCANLIRKKVYQYTLGGEFLAEHPSVAHASVVANCAEAQMTQCCKSSKRTAKGFQWRFEYKKSYPSVNGGFRSVECYDFDGNFVQSFDCVMDAAAFIGETRGSNISACLTGKKLSAGGYQWKAKGAKCVIKKKRDKAKTIKKITKVDIKTGKVLKTYGSLTEAAKDVGCCISNISRCAKDGYACAGYLWQYEASGTYAIDLHATLIKRTRAVNCYDLKGDFIRTFESAKEAALFVNRKRSSISSACNPTSRQKSVGGYQLRHVDAHYPVVELNGNYRYV